MVRSGIKSILDAEDDLDVTGEAGSAMEAIRIAQQLEPDVILMDVRMEGMNGIEACRAIKSARPETAVLMFTSLRRGGCRDGVHRGRSLGLPSEEHGAGGPSEGDSGGGSGHRKSSWTAAREWGGNAPGGHARGVPVGGVPNRAGSPARRSEVRVPASPDIFR